VFFQWAADNHLEVLKATRPHIELFRAWMEHRQLAASTVDQRLSTVCGFYRLAHIDGRIGSNAAQYVRRPQVHPPTHEDSTAASSACSCSPPSTATTNTPPSPSCSASTAYA
jgi:integrase